MTSEDIYEKQVSQLKEIRLNPRKMHQSYLKKHGLFSLIMDKTSEPGCIKWNIRDRIDFIIGKTKKIECYCGSGIYLKPNHEFCSMICAVNNPENIKKMSKIQTENAQVRMDKTRKTILERYGVKWNNDIPGIRESKREKREIGRNQARIERMSNLGLDPVLYTDREYLIKIRDDCTSLSGLSEKYFNGASVVLIQRHYKALGLDTYPKSSSVAENDLDCWIRSLGFETIRNSRTIIYPKEIDIFIPEKNLAIEFNGIYWHSTKKLDNAKDGHIIKTEMSIDSGINLIHIFESELFHKPEIVKSIIHNKLGLSNKIYARKTTVKEIKSTVAKTFFEENHLQGHAIAKHYIGLFLGNELVMCISIGKSRFGKECNLELVRMANKLYTTVVGGFSKLLKYVRKEITVEPILTYCDRKISNGKTYEKFGRFIRKTEPGYSWHSFNGWFSRYQTQKHKLEKLIPKFYDANSTEKQMMERAGYYQLYDSGNLVYILD